jgi:PqqD family protein of HPr-rel-A system
VWRLTPGQTLLRHAWDGEVVLYNDISGDTHLLTETACTLLCRLQAGPADEAALALVCAVDADTVGSLLADLERLSLVDCLPC